VGLGSWVRQHTIASFFILTYVISWVLWLPAAIGLGGSAGSVAVFAGVFGPAIAALTIVHLNGGSAKAFLRNLGLRRRPIWYIGVIALTALPVIANMGLFAVTGGELDMSLLGERLAAYLPLLVVWSFLAIGEEYGWRGFALPRLQASMSPVRASFLLGALWAVWHLPLLAAADEPSHGLDPWPLVGVSLLTVAAIIGYTFFYTYVYNRTRSIGLAIILHGSLTAWNSGFLLDADEQVGATYAHMQAVVTGAVVLGALLLVLATRGRLGFNERQMNLTERVVRPQAS
jgi:membrane protease YdiL (CAAX protease family)